MTSQTIFYLIIGFLTLDFIMDQVLSYLNLHYQKNELPEELKGIYDVDKFRKSQDYLKANTNFSFITSTFSFLLMLIVLGSGILIKLNAEIRVYFHDPIVVSLIFFGILFLASDLLNIPFSVYNTFVIEEKFGFNKTTLKTYISDKLKGYFIAIIMGGIILSVFLWLVLHMGQSFWLYFWIVISSFMILINMFYTSLILPLFNKLSPLETGELRSEIEIYSNKVDFPLNNIFVMNGSKRSSKANAFFSGIGKKKKIVLFDTLINNHTKEELVSVLAHEAGHFKKKHIILGLILSLLQTGLILYILSLFIFSKDLSLALGADDISISLNLIAFTILFSPFSHLIGIFMNLLSRKNEYEADAYAAKTYDGKALQEALKKLSSDNLSNLTPHPAYVFMHYSHPPLLSRLRALNRIQD